MTKHWPALTAQRLPKSFTAEPQSGNVLFTLERLRLSDDDKALAANWTCVKEVVDGKEVSEEQVRGQSFLFFGSRAIRNSAGGMMNTMQYQYVLDPKKQPKTITLIGWKPLTSSLTFQNEKEELLGIYKLEGDRVTIAYRKNGPRPENFESKPESGATLLVLKR